MDWIPAHTKPEDVPLLISQFDRDGNELVDMHCKAVANRHKATEAEETKYARGIEEIRTWARWVGAAGVITSDPLTRDSQASPADRKERQARRAAAKKAAVPVVKPLVAAQRAFELGGHLLKDGPHGWTCVVCRTSSALWNRIAPARCKGTSATRWAASDR